jgi:hypothetical protein
VKTYDLIKVASTKATDGFEDANGYIMHNSASDVDVEVVPYGTEYPAPLLIVNPPNQITGLTSGTPDPVTPNQQIFLRPATSLTGNGSGATFGYLVNVDGIIFTIFSDTAGTGYLENDHISITTTEAHGSQTLSFRLVTGSNRAEVPVTLIHDRPNPLDFAVREYKVLGTTDRAVMVLREHT